MALVLSAAESEQSLATIVEEVFATMIGMRVWRVERMAEPVSARCGAAVSYIGPIPCVLAVACSASLAAAVTHRFMPGTREHPWDDEVQDALGELVNIIGGNFKGLMAGETQLTTPFRFEQMGDDRSGQGHTSVVEPILSLCFAAEEGSCRICVYAGAEPMMAAPGWHRTHRIAS